MSKSAASVILHLLDQRGEGKTICPSEAARALAGSDARSAWEPKMNTVRRAAAKLIADGSITATQKGKVIDLATVKGPIRLRRKN